MFIRRCPNSNAKDLRNHILEWWHGSVQEQLPGIQQSQIDSTNQCKTEKNWVLFWLKWCAWPDRVAQAYNNNSSGARGKSTQSLSSSGQLSRALCLITIKSAVEVTQHFVLSLNHHVSVVLVEEPTPFIRVLSTVSWITENVFGIKQFSCSVKCSVVNTSLPVKCNYPTRTPCENFSVGCSHGKKSCL